MKRNFIKLAALMLTLSFLLVSLISCSGIRIPSFEFDPDILNDGSEKDTASELDKDKLDLLPPLREALVAHFCLSSEDELTSEMLAEVTEIDISPATHKTSKEGYTLFDVYINGDKNYGGALEKRMIKPRYEAMFKQVTEHRDVTNFEKNCFYRFYMEKDLSATALDILKEEMLRDYPETADHSIYVLSQDIVAREANDLVHIIEKYTDYFDSKFIKNGHVIDGSVFSLFPNLAKAKLVGIEADSVPAEANVLLIFPYARAKHDDISKIEITNAYGSYTLTYNKDSELYCIDGESAGYDTELLSHIYNIFVTVMSDGTLDYTPSEITQAEIENMKNGIAAKCTVTLTNGDVHSVLIASNGKWMIHKDNIVYPCGCYIALTGLCPIYKDKDSLKPLLST